MPTTNSNPYRDIVRNGCKEWEAIDEAAALVLPALANGCGAALVRFEPGDGTQYHVGLFSPTAPRHNLLTQTEWLVTVLPGRAYWWRPEIMHWDYVAEKWGAGNHWSGVVIAEFLNAVTRRLPA